MTSTDNRYFILIDEPAGLPYISIGCIYYTSEYKYKQSASQHSGSVLKLPVTPLNTPARLPQEIDLKCMSELGEDEAELLLSLPVDRERLEWFRRRHTLQAFLHLTEGTNVAVEHKGKELRGIIRYIGKKTESRYSVPFSGRVFGIELQVWLVTKYLFNLFLFSEFPLLVSHRAFRRLDFI